MKKINNLLAAFIVVLILMTMYFNSHGQTICRDTTVHKTKSVTSVVTTQVPYDSTYQICEVVQPSGIVQAHYLNSIGSWFTTATSQDAIIKWLLSNGDNRVYIYGVDGMIGTTANDKWIARFNDSCSAHNIETYFVWSKPESVTVQLDKFQKSQLKASSKFGGVISELEPYNNIISYQLFWSYSRQVHDWTKKNNLPNGIYVGWHTQQSTDSIVTLYDFVNLHCYIQSVNMGSSTWEYNYTKSRMTLFANSCVTMKLAQPFPATIIFSDETAFAYNYYVANKADWKAPYNAYLVGWNNLSNGATALIKQKIKPIGYTTFTSAYSLKIKPATGLPSAVMREVLTRPMRKILYVDPQTMKATIIEK